MNKLMRHFLSGGSLAALQLCALGATARAGTITGAHTKITIAANTSFVSMAGSAAISGNVTNNATIGPNNAGGLSPAFNVASGASITGSIINSASGIIKDGREGLAVATGASVAGISNAGKILVSATDTRGQVTGVFYGGHGAAALALTNTGTISVGVTGDFTTGSMRGTAVGVVERVNAGALSPSLTLTNSGGVSLKVVQDNHGSSSNKRAEAGVFDELFQGAGTVSSATLTLTNSGVLNAVATAIAVAGNNYQADADATARVIIGQSETAASVHTGSVASFTISNTAAITIGVKAQATAASSQKVTAFAHVATAIKQVGRNVADFEESLTNSGALTLTAHALAVQTSSSKANATAQIDRVLYQQAFVGSLSAAHAGKANLTITNSGAIALAATAVATGRSAKANANISEVAMQSADRAGVTIQTITNTNTGTVSLAAKATAVAKGTRTASATAEARDVFRQFASDGSVPAANSIVNQTVTNSATLLLSATAKAIKTDSDGDQARAEAEVGPVIGQTAEDVIVTSQTISNSGALTLAAKATASANDIHSVGTEYRAVADAGVRGVFGQDASGTNVASRETNSAITQSITNTATLTLSGAAKAVMLGAGGISTGYNFANAQAQVSDVFGQRAEDAISITQAITNSGIIHIHATATANGTITAGAGRIAPRATAKKIFFQSAEGFDDKSTIIQTITNNGALTVNLKATGKAVGANMAAHGTIDVSKLFDQFAEDAKTITQAISNTGSLGVTATGHVTAGAGFVGQGANVHAANVFSQKANADTSDAHASATQGITNSGALSFTLTSFGQRGGAAADGDEASAVAYLHDVIQQSAKDTVAIKQTVTNTGALTVTLNATATAPQAGHKAYAGANINEFSNLFAQFADADEDKSSISQTISNSGTIQLTDTDIAKVKVSFAGTTAARAFATARKIFFQQAEEAATIAQSLTNTGGITLKMNATATGLAHGTTLTNNAAAHAQARADKFFAQSITDVTSDVTPVLSQSISNTGALSITLNATANGQWALTNHSNQGAFASAKMVGAGGTSNAPLFFQNADNASTGSLNQTISNSGAITIANTAISNTVGNKDLAIAEMDWLFEQDVNHGKTVTQSITNSAPITATLKATAKGALTSAVADVDVHGLGWRQTADNVNTVIQSGSNTSTGTITINATATAVGAKFAEADVRGNDDLFEQSVNSASTSVTQTGVNNAAIKLTYVAAATGTRAEATAKQDNAIFLQEESSSGGASLTQSLANTGALTLNFTATAKGKVAGATISNAHAQAGMESKVWGQADFSTGKPVSDIVTNSGNLTIGILAQATAKQADATAQMRELVNQRATADNLGTITQSVTNSGAVMIAATALANGQRNGQANANVNDTLFDQFADEYGAANQTVTNSGNITVNLLAKAFGNKTSATGSNHANADFDAVVHQETEDGFITTAAGVATNQTITNSGTITLKQVATATGKLRVYADASLDDGLFQQSIEDEDGSTINQKITNSGAISITQSAKAKSTGAVNTTINAFVRATVVKQSVEQQEERGQIANLSITNSGNITVAQAVTATGLLNIDRVDATAEGRGFDQYASEQSSAGLNVGATLSVNNSATVGITANAKSSGKHQAEARASVTFVSQRAEEENRASLSVTNSGKVTLAAAATAAATNSIKEARAEVLGIRQEVTDPVGTNASASLSVSNSGTLSLTATGKATAGIQVPLEVTATAVDQFTKLNGAVSFNNTGTISVNATGTIAAATPAAGAVANNKRTNFDIVSAKGYNFKAEGSQGVSVNNSGTHTFGSPGPKPTLSVSNSGSMSVAAVAVGGGLLHARVSALAAGINVAATSRVSHQDLVSHSPGTLSSKTTHFNGATIRGAISNSGALTVGATAAGAFAHAQGISVGGSIQSESVTNAAGGALSITASGATAVAAGIDLHNAFKTSRTLDARNHHTTHFDTNRVSHTFSGVGPSTNVTGNVTNSGSITVSATGTVSEKADGIAINASSVNDTILNAGSITASASGPGAVANGIRLYASKTVTTFTDTFRHFNSATAHGATNSSAFATKHAHTHIGNVTVLGTLSNTGTITVTATAAGSAATANGISVDGGTLTGSSFLNAGGTINATATGKTATANAMLLNGAGAINVSDKSGNLNATATASAGAAAANGVNLSDVALNPSTFTGGGGTVSANATGGAATANGWLVTGTGKITMVGSGGVLTVKANSSNAVATANGINIQGGPLTGSSIINGDTINVSATGATGTTPVANAILAVGTGAFTVGNGSTGNLSSLVTVGTTTSYGTAINVNGAASAAIALQGGIIAGNIVEASGGNAITVSGGNTTFNGSINPSKAQLGSLVISSGGTLTLGVNGGLGAGNAWVGTFTQTGTLGLNETGDTTLSGAIHATTATLSGPAALNINVSGSTPVGLSTTYKVVFTTGTLSGTFSSIAVTDPTFFTASGVYTANEADITLTRAALGSVPGLTSNESAVGAALEKIYDAGGGTGPLGSLTNALFALTPAQYAEALQELSGTSVGDLANADASDLENTLDTIIDHLGDSTGGGSGGGTAFNYAPGVQQAQLADGHFNVWAGGVAGGSGIATTTAGPGYHVNQNGLMGGVDAQFLPNTTLGLSLAYVNGTMHTLNGLDRGGFNVIEISGYGRYDAPNAPFYALGDVSYGAFNNTLHRTISIPGLASAVVNGKYSSDTVALYGEAGYHLSPDQFPVSLTPYVAVSYLDASSDPFTETGTFVAPLAVASASSNSLYSYLGAQWQQTFPSDNNMAITARIKAAWQHDFSSSAWTMAASFAPVSGIASFGIRNNALSTDYAFINAGVTISSSSNVDLNLDYDGHLASDRTENALIGRLVFKF